VPDPVGGAKTPSGHPPAAVEMYCEPV